MLEVFLLVMGGGMILAPLVRWTVCHDPHPILDLPVGWLLHHYLLRPLRALKST